MPCSESISSSRVCSCCDWCRGCAGCVPGYTYVRGRLQGAGKICRRIRKGVMQWSLGSYAQLVAAPLKSPSQDVSPL